MDEAAALPVRTGALLPEGLAQLRLVLGVSVDASDLDGRVCELALVAVSDVSVECSALPARARLLEGPAELRLVERWLLVLAQLHLDRATRRLRWRDSLLSLLGVDGSRVGVRPGCRATTRAAGTRRGRRSRRASRMDCGSPAPRNCVCARRDSCLLAAVSHVARPGDLVVRNRVEGHAPHRQRARCWIHLHGQRCKEIAVERLLRGSFEVH